MKLNVQGNAQLFVVAWLCAGTVANAAALQEKKTKRQKKSAQAVVRKIVTEDKDGDGEPRVISVRVEKNVTQENDEKPKVSGQIVIVGPDGKKKTIDLSKVTGGEHGVIMLGDGGAKEMAFDVLKDLDINLDLDVLKDGPNVQVIRADATGEARYRIGVHCEPVDDAIRAHVELPKGAMLVQELLDEAPAAKGGMKRYDIITKVAGKPVKSLDQMVERIQKSKGKALQFTVRRGGKNVSVKVTPEKRKAEAVAKIMNEWTDKSGKKMMFSFEPDKMGDAHQMIVESLKPGMIMNSDEDVKVFMKRLPGIVQNGRKMQVRIMKKEGDGDAETKVIVMADDKDDDDDDDDDGEDGDDEDDEDDEEGDHDDDHVHQHRSKRHQAELRERMRDLTKEIERIERALKKLESDDRD